jgi:EVE domain
VPERTDAARDRRYWVNTVSLDHVEGAVTGGFTQADHGANTRLRHLAAGDGIIFYSPRTSLQGGTPVRRFTAIATVTGAEPYPVVVSDVMRPWRLDVRFHPGTPVDAKPLVEELSFVTDPSHWGLPFRRGLFAIPEADFRLIAERMGARILA